MQPPQTYNQQEWIWHASFRGHWTFTKRIEHVHFFWPGIYTSGPYPRVLLSMNTRRHILSMSASAQDSPPAEGACFECLTVSLPGPFWGITVWSHAGMFWVAYSAIDTFSCLSLISSIWTSNLSFQKIPGTSLSMPPSFHIVSVSSHSELEYSAEWILSFSGLDVYINIKVFDLHVQSPGLNPQNTNIHAYTELSSNSPNPGIGVNPFL